MNPLSCLALLLVAVCALAEDAHDVASICESSTNDGVVQMCDMAQSALVAAAQMEARILSAAGVPTEEAAETVMAKRKNEFMRYGKRKNEFMRYGKRKNEFMRYGKRKNEFMRYGKRKNEFMRYGRKNEFMRYGKRKNEFMRYGRK